MILLQTKGKAADKTLEQGFLEEFKGTCKTSSECELHVKQQKAIWNAPSPSFTFNIQLTTVIVHRISNTNVYR